MQENYNHHDIEKKQQQKWEKRASFIVNEQSPKPKFYCLSMFSYPSGKLHMGHVRNYTIGDCIARFHHLRGYNVLQPFGWDAFGLPAENAALQHNIAPAKWTYDNIDYMRSQLKSMGLAVDWSREFATCDKDYYKHQQWLFIQLYKKGLIYKKNGIVNWDPVDQTVLANEQVIDGKGWRSGAVVEKKEIPMYYFKIADYADELLTGLEQLEQWPEQVKLMQENWIGKSTGLEISFAIHKEQQHTNLGSDGGGVGGVGQLKVYTTRADTLMGVSFIAISIEHPLIALAKLNNPAIDDFINDCRLGGVSEAELATQEKKGIDTGIRVIHPVSKELLPVWVANYVLANYGVGAVMGVPAHCDPDFEFAKKYALPIKVVLADSRHSAQNDNGQSSHNQATPKQASCTNLGELNYYYAVNSGELNDLPAVKVLSKFTELLEHSGQGKSETNFRLRDWGISRQRYWGCPIPIVYCEFCGDVPVKETDLPVVLPEQVIPDGIGSPLARMPEFYSTNCPNCHSPARRETDTMDTFVDSSWYYARYASHDCATAILDQRANYWTPVDQYIGGIEHAVLHLLYARFFHKCLRDLKLINSDEPFTRLLTQGMVHAETFYRQDAGGKKTWFHPADVKVQRNDRGDIISAVYKGDNQAVVIGGMEKMSKSKNNGVDPALFVHKYGADTARLFSLFAAPPEAALEWSEHGIEGANRFIRRLWRFVFEHIQKGIVNKYTEGELSSEQSKLRHNLHKTIAKVTNDFAIRQQFNTVIASIMELLNDYSRVAFNTPVGRELAQEVLEAALIMLAPIIPHVCEELWSNLRPNTELLAQSWPSVDQNALAISEVEMIIQVNGKLRGKIMVDASPDKAQIEQLAKENHNVHKFIAGQAIKKIIIVPNKLINIVV